ncbi:hypothetical protein [Polyangium aurulentum]|uniref:hypothetical protein n=1 Tax=Polyangium aurulentum TaxID=2567896 RepID=UPI0010AEE6E3|nr:hypothetical protein [Polyangium aurulentum]UQA55970.1 hypothetical protein E8A73_032225 [Polyangium aurulentum]
MSVTPTSKTPIGRCEEKSLFTRTMLRKFKDVTPLDGLADKLEDATDQLLARQAAYHEKVKALIVLRVEVKYVDLLSDRGVRVALKRAEIEDGKPGGRLVSVLFPSGTTPIMKPIGDAQVKEMRALEGRYKEAESIFPAAVDERVKIEALRVQYETALDNRKKGMEEAAQARAARDMAKEDFLDVFTEVANRIRAAFPRDKKTTDLFFSRDKAVSNADDGGEGEDDEEGGGEG